MIDEEKIRKIVKEEVEKFKSDFWVEPEIHYRHHKELEDIDSDLEVSHLDQHKWGSDFISWWRSTASTIGNWILILILGALFTLLGLVAAAKLKLGF